MKIQFASDLHLEFSINQKFLSNHPIKAIGNILLLGGDIIPFTLLEKAMDFFRLLSDKFEQVYWIPGNHEYYHFNTDAGRIGSFKESILPNVTLLNNTTIVHNGIKLIFSTLWSRISIENELSVKKGMADFRYIFKGNNLLTVEDYNNWHSEALFFLQSEVSKKSQLPSIVLTHHVPTFVHYPKEFLQIPINGGFVTEMQDFILGAGFDYWIYGHHHRNTSAFKIGKTQLDTNQLGYVWHKENIGFQDNKYFELNT